VREASWRARKTSRASSSHFGGDAGIALLRVIPILLDGIALAQLHTSTALQLSKAVCGAVELWR